MHARLYLLPSTLAFLVILSNAIGCGREGQEARNPPLHTVTDNAIASPTNHTTPRKSAPRTTSLGSVDTEIAAPEQVDDPSTGGAPADGSPGGATSGIGGTAAVTPQGALPVSGANGGTSAGLPGTTGRIGGGPASGSGGSVTGDGQHGNSGGAMGTKPHATSP
ncbi:MAG: hypothetical protein NVS3B20_04940 [Polyangiales bacterium]